jgi:hypothetical protein
VRQAHVAGIDLRESNTVLDPGADEIHQVQAQVTRLDIGDLDQRHSRTGCLQAVEASRAHPRGAETGRSRGRCLQPGLDPHVPLALAEVCERRAAVWATPAEAHIRGPHVHLEQPGTSQIGAAEIGAAQVRVGKHDPAQVGETQVAQSEVQARRLANRGDALLAVSPVEDVHHPRVRRARGEHALGQAQVAVKGRARPVEQSPRGP